MSWNRCTSLRSHSRPRRVSDSRAPDQSWRRSGSRMSPAGQVARALEKRRKPTNSSAQLVDRKVVRLSSWHELVEVHLATTRPVDDHVSGEGAIGQPLPLDALSAHGTAAQERAEAAGTLCLGSGAMP